MEFKIALRNKKNEITDYTFISKEDYEYLNKFNCSKDKNNYVKISIDNKSYRLHRFIMINILKNDISYKTKIDHIDNNPLNNRRTNLRIVTDSENARNREKQKMTSSKYIGVSFKKNINKYQSSIYINKTKKLYAIYDNEIHAAHQYNLWCEEYNLYTSKLNIIDKKYLNDFILYTPLEKKNNLPKGIFITPNNTYRVRIQFNKKRINYGSYQSLEEAVKVKDIKLKELKNNENILNEHQKIKKNNNGDCIIELFNSMKIKVGETIVDEDKYHELICKSWYLNDKYISNSKLGQLHRYIMNYSGDDYIDHINNNPLDNRKSNLRIVTPKQNSMNKSPHKNTTSKYVGVHLNIHNKWVSKIYVNNKYIHLGSFDNEEMAANARDIATKKYYCEFGNLNFD
jgi:hypothetical protein